MAAAMVVLGAACAREEGSDPVVAATASPATAAPATDPPTSSTTVLVTLLPTTVVFPSAPQPTPEQAAALLLAAWQAGDRVTAGAVATPAAADALFAVPPVSATARGCNEGGTDPTYCVYRTDAGELQLRMNRAGEAGWVVTAAILGT